MTTRFTICSVFTATFQSLYHFTVGMPVDAWLTTEPGYPWERDRL
jgi:hypothetical protein